MSDIDRSGLRQNYWKTVPMEKMNRQEWEALCDGCGKCCLNKLEDEDTGEVALTNVACRLLDDATCLCSQYDIRHQFVPECIVLTPKTI
ncbi:MAG: YcgN family cysteine cluster protein, partial [Marivivens sp.]|nr:YcgN family cysteine cluster protein [Marivivens sp.]NDH02182.1 YcgN family cysteine cluster protein [Marivivens sp.]